MYLNKYNDMHAYKVNTVRTFLDTQLLSSNIYQQIRHEKMRHWKSDPPPQKETFLPTAQF